MQGFAVAAELYRMEEDMDQNMIDRINALYHKSQSTGLTEEEKAEQAALRKAYI